MQKQKIYKFRGIADLYADDNGNFFFNQKPVPKVYNNGSLSALVSKPPALVGSPDRQALNAKRKY